MAKKRVTRTCKTCGDLFEFRPSPSSVAKGWGKYCGITCKKQGMSEAHRRHGHSMNGSTSRTYSTWSCMVQRCTNPKHKQFRDYGGRGITISPEWMAFAAFLSDMGERPSGLYLDRIDNSKGYFKENCRWATRSEQQRNMRSNRLLTLNGRTQCVTAWSEELGIKIATIYWRLNHGFTTAQVLGTRRWRHIAHDS